MRQRGSGFTLAQLLVVVAIVTTLTAFGMVGLHSLAPTRHCGHRRSLSDVVSFMRSTHCCNSVHAGVMLKQLVAHQSVWRTQDTDRNGVADYWTRDVTAFHCIHDAADKQLAFIDLAFARADNAPARAYPELGGVISPKQGYFVQAMRIDQDGRPYVDPSLPPPRAGNAPPGPSTNASRFGFVIYPAVYEADGEKVYIVNEDGVVWQKDLGAGAPAPLDRRLAAPPGNDTTWAQFGG